MCAMQGLACVNACEEQNIHPSIISRQVDPPYACLANLFPQRLSPSDRYKPEFLHSCTTNHMLTGNNVSAFPPGRAWCFRRSRQSI